MNALQKFVFPEKSPYHPETAEWLLAALPDRNARVDELQRKQAVTKIQEQGLPTPKLERWKYTNLARAVKHIEGGLSKAQCAIDGAAAVVQKLSLQDAMALDWVRDYLGAKPPQEDKFGDWALWHASNAFLEEVIVIDVPAGKIVDKPVDISFGAHQSGFSMPRILIRLGQGAELTIYERHEGPGAWWNNTLTQIVVGDNAKLRHYRLQNYGPDVVYTQSTHVVTGRDALYEAYALTTGAGTSRNQIHAELGGQNGTCSLFGANLLHNKQLGDTTITIEHKAPHCNSNQFYRTVLEDRGHGVFQGKVHVHQAAQKTDGYQLSNALLLSEGAEMDTKPELEIYADDVKCSHGATTGQIEENSLFYLRSRGIPEEEARALLVKAFVNEVVEKLGDTGLNAAIEQRVAQWLKP